MFLEMIRERRSIRKYQSKVVESEKVELLVEAALRAPSSRGLNPWQFIVITEPETLSQLSKAKPHSSFIKDAPLGIVVCADSKRCDVWVEDASITVTYIQLAAESLGLGSCWIQIRERMFDEIKTAEEYVKEVLAIPSDLKVEAMVAIGYPAEKLTPHAKNELQYDKIHYNKF